jgi:hypothetical protein
MADPAIAMIKQFSSTGYLRKRLPSELLVLNGGITRQAGAVASMAVETVGASAAAVTAVGSVASAVMGRVAEAKMKGYEGDPCGDCGNFTLDEGLRGRPLRRLRELHPGPQRHLHEVQHLRRHLGLQLDRAEAGAAGPIPRPPPARAKG